MVFIYEYRWVFKIPLKFDSRLISIQLYLPWIFFFVLFNNSIIIFIKKKKNTYISTAGQNIMMLPWCNCPISLSITNEEIHIIMEIYRIITLIFKIHGDLRYYTQRFSDYLNIFYFILFTLCFRNEKYINLVFRFLM